MQLSFDSPVEVIAARKSGIADAEAHADVGWKAAAFDVVCCCARNHVPFTADHVWTMLPVLYPDVTTHEPAALGPVFLRAAREGIIVKTGMLRSSKLKRRHRDLTEWVGL